ncbi:hypothetical protein NECAME_10596 [Necator americanus]|uniref:Uncharacterized protein n=1 Tax=Necator americanus TaxID=51031 RepID=W2T8Z4_NECAM|nr:hypothetical protein NECAME_10596 [Necator americanus]ETN78089.1 hypothetical protein NECAME_10596 [Necator americanus]
MDKSALEFELFKFLVVGKQPLHWAQLAHDHSCTFLRFSIANNAIHVSYALLPLAQSLYKKVWITVLPKPPIPFCSSSDLSAAAAAAVPCYVSEILQRISHIGI